ncbi:MAG: 3-dehydroquinate synthase [Acidobacteriota bacterium]
MDTTIGPIKIPRKQSTYSIEIGEGLISDVGRWSATALGRESGRVLIVSNRKVFGLYGRKVETGLRERGFKPHVHLIGDGERFKDLRSLENTLRALSQNGFTRTDVVLALGGGVVGDLAGFAASVHLRGIDLLQIPTTLLSMIDSSVGGKTAVNTPFGKNLVGTFYQPKGVLIDVGTLQTLPRREITAGFCEAVKHGAISGHSLFRQTASFLESCKPADFRVPSKFDLLVPELVTLIGEQLKFKAKIVQNDETESSANTSPRSRKILNFGHTFAHALEKASNYRYLKHGEAVGYGIMFAARLSKKLELLGQDEVNSLNDVVRRAGSLPAIIDIDQSKILESFKHDKKRVGDSLQWVLLKGIGKPVIVPDREIPGPAISSTFKTIFQK